MPALENAGIVAGLQTIVTQATLVRYAMAVGCLTLFIQRAYPAKNHVMLRSQCRIISRERPPNATSDRETDTCG